MKSSFKKWNWGSISKGVLLIGLALCLLFCSSASADENESVNETSSIDSNSGSEQDTQPPVWLVVIVIFLIVVMAYLGFRSGDLGH